MWKLAGAAAVQAWLPFVYWPVACMCRGHAQTFGGCGGMGRPPAGAAVSSPDCPAHSLRIFSWQQILVILQANCFRRRERSLCAEGPLHCSSACWRAQSDCGPLLSSPTAGRVSQGGAEQGGSRASFAPWAPAGQLIEPRRLQGGPASPQSGPQQVPGPPPHQPPDVCLPLRELPQTLTGVANCVECSGTKCYYCSAWSSPIWTNPGPTLTEVRAAPRPGRRCRTAAPPYLLLPAQLADCCVCCVQPSLQCRALSTGANCRGTGLIGTATKDAIFGGCLPGRWHARSG